MIVHILQKVASLENGDSTSSVLEYPSFSFDFILDAYVVLIVIGLALTALPHAVMGLHLHVEFWIAVHDTTFFYKALKGTNFHSQTEGFVGKICQTVPSDFSFGGDYLFLGFF